jgi:cation-transporting ATPase 13A1
MRTILFSAERVTMNNLESFVFIGFLLIFALIASGYAPIPGRTLIFSPKIRS